MRRILWFFSTIITYVVFTNLLPDSIINGYPILLPTIGAVLITFLGIQTLADFKGWDEFHSPVGGTNWRHYLVYCSVIPTLLLWFLISDIYISKKFSELKSFGERTTGIITGGYSIKLRRGQSNEVTYKFTTQEGLLVEKTELVSEDEFNSLSEGQKVEVIYSKRNPEISSLLIDDLSFIEFNYKDGEKNITMNDLLHLVDLKHDSLGIALNNMNYKWEFDDRDSTWKNEKRKQYIKSDYKNHIVFNTFKLDETKSMSLEEQFTRYEKQFLQLNFDKTKNDTIVFLTNNKYKVGISLTIKATGLIGQKVELEKKLL